MLQTSLHIAPGIGVPGEFAAGLTGVSEIRSQPPTDWANGKRERARKRQEDGRAAAITACAPSNLENRARATESTKKLLPPTALVRYADSSSNTR